MPHSISSRNTMWAGPIWSTVYSIDAPRKYILTRAVRAAYYEYFRTSEIYTRASNNPGRYRNRPSLISLQFSFSLDEARRALRPLWTKSMDVRSDHTVTVHVWSRHPGCMLMASPDATASMMSTKRRKWKNVFSVRNERSFLCIHQLKETISQH